MHHDLTDPGAPPHPVPLDQARRAHRDRELPGQAAPVVDRDADSEELFRLLVANVRDYAIFMLDPGGRIATWNIGAERIKRYRAEDIIGRHFSVFYPDEDVRAGKCEIGLATAARDGRFEDEGWRLRSDGSRFWANVVITAIRDASGSLIGFAKVTRDLTERKRSEDERTARLAAEQANRTKDEFLALLGHELRNPLAPIVTALQLIKLRGDTPSPREVRVLERQVQQLLHLVDDLLDVSRIARGKLELKSQVIDLRGPISRAIEIASPLIEHKRHHLDVQVAPHTTMIDGDEARLTQVFANLLTNAAKYTDPGGHIGLRVWPADGEVVIEVRDDGIGIDRDLLPRLFDPFVQGAQNGERAAGGLGLGLGLVRSLVELHGGRVEAHSAGPRLGSTFTVRLPAGSPPPSRATSRQIAAAFPTEPATRRILVVDDNEDARGLLADILSQLGHDVRAVGDGPQALAMLREFTPDVAVLDIGLPGMDGYELAAQLHRALPGSGVRVIALSGYGQASDRARSEAAGFAGHLVKPVEVRRLLEAIAPAAR
ncbi:MAG TPA: ATP-binding protein [Kofleriaceae bacterium]|nr:ATP-binding protein [Kofleriaceae bacterium]